MGEKYQCSTECFDLILFNAGRTEGRFAVIDSPVKQQLNKHIKRPSNVLPGSGDPHCSTPWSFFAYRGLMSNDQTKKWYPSSGDRERPEEDWKKIMKCNKTIPCKECKDFKHARSEVTDRYTPNTPKTGLN